MLTSVRALRAAITVLAAAAMTTAMTAGPAAAKESTPESQAAAVKLAAAWKVSLAEATARIERQDRVVELSQALTMALGAATAYGHGPTRRRPMGDSPGHRDRDSSRVCSRRWSSRLCSMEFFGLFTLLSPVAVSVPTIVLS